MPHNTGANEPKILAIAAYTEGPWTVSLKIHPHVPGYNKLEITGPDGVPMPDTVRDAITDLFLMRLQNPEQRDGHG